MRFKCQCGPGCQSSGVLQLNTESAFHQNGSIIGAGLMKKLCTASFSQSIQEGGEGQVVKNVSEQVSPKDAHPGHSFKMSCEQEWSEVT